MNGNLEKIGAAQFRAKYVTVMFTLSFMTLGRIIEVINPTGAQ